MLNTGVVRYYYVVHDSLIYNAYVDYHFPKTDHNWLANTGLRLGVVNLRNTPPPMSSGGFDSAVYTSVAEGRSWSIEFTKKL